MQSQNTNDRSYWVGYDDPREGHHTVTINSAVQARPLEIDRRIFVRDCLDGAIYILRVDRGPLFFPPRIHGEEQLATYYCTLVRTCSGDMVTTGRPRPGSFADLQSVSSEHASAAQAQLNANDAMLGVRSGEPDIRVCVDTLGSGALPRNVGIFGTVGSGKTNSSAVLIEEAAAAGWCVCVIDVEGEYSALNKAARKKATLQGTTATSQKTVSNLHRLLPSSSSQRTRESRFLIPVSSYPIELLGALIEATEAQRRLIRNCVNQLPTDYTLGDLIEAVRLERPLDGRSTPTQEIALGRLEELARTGLFDDGKPGKSRKEIQAAELLGEGRVNVFDLSGLNDRYRNIATGYILNAVFNHADKVERGKITAAGPRPPVMLVVEEIQTFFGSIDETRDVVLHFLQDIARRGRKRWLSLVAVSQQPAALPPKFFELLNSKIIHQTRSATNIESLKQSCGEIDAVYWKRLSHLPVGEAILAGPAFFGEGLVKMRPSFGSISK